MATVAYKQGIILERFWAALRLRRSKGSSEASNLLALEPPQIDLFWVVPERHHRSRIPQEGPFPGWVPVLNRKKTQMGLQGGLRKSGYFLIPTLMLNLKVKIAADGTKNGILPH